MSKVVTIIGGSGFVGRYIARRMAKNGWRVRVTSRRPNEALFVKPYGSVGQVEPIFCNIRDDDSVRAAIQGSDAVINCVGILGNFRANTFDKIHAEGAERVARISKDLGTSKLVHISAIGAEADSESEYFKSKAEGEAGILKHRSDAVILRPSAIFGVEDTFFNKLAFMSRFAPVMKIVGGKTRLQPVYVDDVAQAVVVAAEGAADSGIYELGGPEIKTMHELVDDMLAVVHRRRLVIDMPFWVANIAALMLDAAQAISVGLFQNKILTRDLVTQLRSDNVVAEDANGLADLGITPTAMSVILPDYLWRFRPSGQYDEIKDSASNLRA